MCIHLCVCVRDSEKLDDKAPAVPPVSASPAGDAAATPAAEEKKAPAASQEESKDSERKEEKMDDQ